MAKQKRKPVVSGAHPVGGKKPIVPSEIITSSPNWAFSFEFFGQRRYFGLDTVESEWFVSLLEKLKELCQTEAEGFKKDTTLKQRWRYHLIDWTLTGVPIGRHHLDWLPSDYLNNEDDFPLLQFQVSKALGRVVGFWGINSNVFYIVLLDPCHNIQPSGGKYGYKVNDNHPLSCKYTSLLKDIENCKKKRTSHCDECKVYATLDKIPSVDNQTNFFAAFIDDDMKKRLEGKSHQEIVNIFELGLTAAEKDDKRSN